MYAFLMIMSCVVFLVEIQAQNCFNYDLPDENGITAKQILGNCGVVNIQTSNDPVKLRCVVQAFQAINEDGTLNKDALIGVMKTYGYEMYLDAILKLTDSCSQSTVEYFVSCYPPGAEKICPKDEIYGNP